jgi:hypothetical protein
MQTDGYEFESRYGFEDNELDEDNEPITESEYHEKLNAIIQSCKGHYSFKYAQNLNLEGEIQGKIPMVAFDCLNQISGLTGTQFGDLVAVLIALDFSKVNRMVRGFYDKNPELRLALHEWGKLQSVRG